MSLGVFVGQEIDRFNTSCSPTMKRSTLMNLGKAIEGTVVMSMELERMFNNFLNNKVPSSVGEGSLSIPEAPQAPG